MFRNLNHGMIDANSVEELYYLASLDNVESILANGMLSHVRANRRFHPADMSNHEVQDRRASKVIERAQRPPQPHSKPLRLHRFVNLFLNPHNAMIVAIYDRGNGMPSNTMCIVRISRALLDRGDAILTNQNASTDAAEFYIRDSFRLDATRTQYLSDHQAFFKRGTDDDPVGRKQVRQAEVLVPYEIHASYITGFFVSCMEACNILQARLASVGRGDLHISINPDVFFQGEHDRLAPAGTAQSMPNVTLQDFNPLQPMHAPDATYPESSDDEDAEDQAQPIHQVHR